MNLPIWTEFYISKLGLSGSKNLHHLYIFKNIPDSDMAGVDVEPTYVILWKLIYLLPTY